MRITPAQQADVVAVIRSHEFLSLVVISYTFLTPFGFSVKILIALCLCLFEGALERISSIMAFNKDASLHHLWANELPMRFWLSDFAEGRQPDWTTAQEAAKNETQRLDAEVKYTVEGYSGNFLRFAFHLVVYASVNAFKILAGYGIAFLLQRYVPGFVAAIT